MSQLEKELDGKVIPVLVRISVSGTSRRTFLSESEMSLELIPVDSENDDYDGTGLEGSLEIVAPVSKIRSTVRRITHIPEEAKPLYEEVHDSSLVKVTKDLDKRRGRDSNPLILDVLDVIDTVIGPGKPTEN